MKVMLLQDRRPDDPKMLIGRDGNRGTRSRRLATVGSIIVWGGLMAAAMPAAFGQETLAATHAGKHCLWRARSATATLYLLGSVHLMRPEAYPLAEEIETAFEVSSVAVFEVDLGAEGTAAAAFGALAAGMLPEGTSLREVVSDETWKLAERRATESGLDFDGMQGMRPWMVATTLALTELQGAGYSPTDGVDRYLYRRARDGGKTVQGLETVEFQLSLLAGLSREQDEAFLLQTVRELDTVIPMVDELVDHWRNGRVEEAGALLVEGFLQFPELFKTMVSDRNATWLPRLEELLAGAEPAFVVVGALHLVGDDGVIEMLRSKGYTVEQL